MSSANPVVLCVDDEPANLKLLENILVPRGYEVVTASNGKDALEKIRTQRIDLVLLDVMMPEMDGFAVCKEIKGNSKYQGIPVIMITALSTKQDRVKGIEAGAEEFLSKPFDQMEVLARIRMLLKVKELNEDLNSAYGNILNINAYGEHAVSAFNPTEFRFDESIDGIMDFLVRKRSDEAEKPRYVFIRTADAKGEYVWFSYEFVLNALAKSRLGLNIIPKLRQDVHTLYGKPGVIEKNLKGFAEKVEDMNIQFENVACYLSEPLCVVAVNYGKNVTAHEAAVLDTFVTQALFMRSLSGQIKATDDAFEYNIHTLARATEVNDEDTGNHIKRVGVYCGLLAMRLGMDDKFAKDIIRQAAMHDVGKVHIHPDILKKPTPLTAEEFETMKRHTVFGAKIIGDHESFRIGRNIALTHHERWDGTGYPRGLSGDQTPVEGRIVAIADVYDALRNKRVYKPAYDHLSAYRIITEGDGRTSPRHFEPKVMIAFKDLAGKFEEIYETLNG